VHILLDEEFAALDADAAENILDHRKELDVIDRTSELVVAEVSGAAVIGLAT
jgi:hypothetical protein